MTTTLLARPTAARATAARTTCQTFAGSLIVPCPNTATRTVVRRGTARQVCAAHA